MLKKNTAPTATTTNNTSLNVAFTLEPDDHGCKDFLSTTHHLQQSACNLIFVHSSRSQRLSRWSLLQRIAQLFSACSKRQVSSDNTKVATTHILGIGRWEEGRLRHPLYTPMARHDVAGPAWQGWPGLARRGQVWPGVAGPSMAGLAWHGQAGKAWPGIPRWWTKLFGKPSCACC